MRALETPDRVTWHLDDAARHVVADPGLLDRVLANVLENALRHGGSDGVVVTTSTLGPRVELRVADHGPGIPESMRERVFDRFYRADPARSRTQGSTGLGLSIVQALVSRHGGRLTLLNRPEGGLRVQLQLRPSPCAPDITSGNNRSERP